MTIGMFVTLGVGLVVVMVGTSLPKRKSAPDSLMAAGGTMGFVLFGLTVSVLFRSGHFESYDVLMLGNLGMALGVLLFAMGFLLDRLARRRQSSQALPAQF